MSATHPPYNAASFLRRFQATAPQTPRKRSPISFQEIISYLNEKKTSILYLPERVEVIEEMPLTNVGKVDKKRLREVIQEKLKKEGKI